jgi:hypothetical protein
LDTFSSNCSATVLIDLAVRKLFLGESAAGQSNVVLDCLFAPEIVCERTGAGDVEFKVRIDGASGLPGAATDVAGVVGGGSVEGVEVVVVSL